MKSGAAAAFKLSPALGWLLARTSVIALVLGDSEQSLRPSMISFLDCLRLSCKTWPESSPPNLCFIRVESLRPLKVR
jgi:hypothetical protein